MDHDTIRALRRESHGDGDEFFELLRDRAIGDGASSNAQKAFITFGARASIFFSLVRFSLLYMRFVSYCSFLIGVKFGYRISGGMSLIVLANRW